MLFLTLLIGIFILIQGIFEVILAFQIRPTGNWFWVLLSGLINSDQYYSRDVDLVEVARGSRVGVGGVGGD